MHPKRTHLQIAKTSQTSKEVWVHCPRCNAAAILFPAAEGRRLSCLKCALEKHYEWNGYLTWPKRDPIDPHTGLSLWLKWPCCGQFVWALNPTQLDVLESYVGADLRPSGTFKQGKFVSWQNSTYENRLPSWMKLARNRRSILKAIERIRRDRPLPAQETS